MKPPERIRAQNTCVKSGRTRIEYIAIPTPIHQVLQPPLEPKERATGRGTRPWAESADGHLEASLSQRFPHLRIGE
jgi:hypothetical protein